MLDRIIHIMIYLGSALMVYNIYSYTRFARRLRKEHMEKDAGLLSVPIVLLTLFLLGYLAVGLFGNPDLIISGILFGGSIFVFLIFYLLRKIAFRLLEDSQLEAKLMAAEEGSRTKSAFLSGVSHEMRTPLNVILGMDTLALKNPALQPETREQLEKIGVSARHLLGLIDSVLDMSRIESGRMELKQAPFSLPELLEQLDLMTGARCGEKGLRYESSADGVTDTRLIGDAAKLRQILFSLLDNAIKFTPAPGTVTFRTEQLPAENGSPLLRFTVTDTGIGMDSDFLPNLFCLFSREDATTTSQYGGSGLGLAITKNLVDLMGGEIGASSEKGAGSVFTVTLPFARAELPPAPEPEDKTAPPDLRGRRVLIVEDTDLNAEILTDLLEMEEVSSERAENGRIALDLFTEKPPGWYDAILMDLRMPVMDGLEAARAIRALDRPDAKTIPILALTANALDEDKQNSLAAGMDVHLSKPVDSDLLYSTLGELIARRKAAD